MEASGSHICACQYSDNHHFPRNLELRYSVQLILATEFVLTCIFLCHRLFGVLAVNGAVEWLMSESSHTYCDFPFLWS